MLYDNSTPEKSVASWILEQTKTGKLDVTSGYFTVGILALISRELNQKIENYRFVLGDIVSNDQDKENPINLLTETITVDAALQLNKVAREAVAFLRQENVKVRTVEPNFCHAKTILFRTLRQADSYFVTGSSNLTEAGLGLQHTSNIELNVVGQGSAADYNEICQWFDGLWERDQTQDYKTVEGKKIPFKQYLISQIEGIFRLYTPRELYFKTLFELFRDQMLELESNPGLQQRIGHLKHTKIFRTLYEFQQKGVLSLIKKMEDYQGAILADAVGLGKTWSALAVIKYYELKGYQCVLLCPKKLSHNWTRYLKNCGSIFDSDRLDYVVRYHTDLQDMRLETNHSDGLTLDNFFQGDKPKLFVIDESHNLRNSKSGRYQYLVEKLLQANREVRVLLLSATPINNDFKDLRNQLALLVKDQDNGFSDARGIQVESLETQFRLASKAFGEWSADPQRNIRSLLQKLPEPVTRLIDRIIVARNRRHIKGLSGGLDFPEMTAPVNVCMESLNISEFARFEQILDALPRVFAAYKPAMYLVQPKAVSVLEDEAQRDQALVVMLNKLLVKRLESSWQAFHQTLRAVHAVHSKTLTAVTAYRKQKQDTTLVTNLDSLNTSEDEFDFPLGKREIRISEIEAAGTLDSFHDHLKEDLARLDSLIAKLAAYAQAIASENGNTSADPKLQHLFELIDQRLAAAPRPEKRRVIIFTSYEDTARYLFGEFTRRGYVRIAMVSGSGARLSEDPGVLHINFEPVLERFCPYTKLYREKEWKDYQHIPKEPDGWESFDPWKSWVRGVSPATAEKLDSPVEILIATDCLSEGQNLQDCDTVINYDIHWNPVRLIQRLGRIDRIGSPNTTVTGINFWPTATVNDYLGLQKRVEDRAIAIAVAGSEVPSFTEKVRERLHDASFQEELEARMLAHLDSSWEDLERSADTLDFSDLSLEVFRQDLLRELGEHQKAYADMPLGVFTGFRPDDTTRPDGVVALLGYPSRKNGARSPYHRHNLVYLDLHGNVVLDRSGDVLKFLSDHQSHDRSVPQAIDQNDPAAIGCLSSSIKTWLASFSTGAALDDFLVGLQGNDPAKKPLHNDGKTLEQQYDPENCDLILWFVINANT
ncbi:MAG: SNF2-related protein [Akkermansiaceae bacterium]